MALEVFDFPQEVFLLLVLENMGVEIVVIDCLRVVKVYSDKEGLVLGRVIGPISERLNVWVLRALKSHDGLWQFLLTTGDGLVGGSRLEQASQLIMTRLEWCGRYNTHLLRPHFLLLLHFNLLLQALVMILKILL